MLTSCQFRPILTLGCHSNWLFNTNSELVDVALPEYVKGTIHQKSETQNLNAEVAIRFIIKVLKRKAVPF